MTPLVSVVMSIYNGAADIPVAFGDLFDQSLQDFEIVVINDGSTDDSGVLLEEIARRDPRVTVLHQANTGIAGALAAGCRIASGRFIARMDVDDRSHPERFARQVDYLLTRPDAVMCGTWALQAMAGADPDAIVAPPDDHAALLAAMERGGNPFVHGSVMFRRSAYIDLADGYRIPGFSEDFDLWLRLSGFGRLGMVTETLYLYSLTPAGLTFGAFALEPRVRQLCLDLHAERKRGREQTDWRSRIHEIQSGRGEPADAATRATSAAYASALRSLRARRWSEYRRALEVAAAGSGPRAARARWLRRCAWAAPMVRRVLSWRLARAGDRYSRPLPAPVSIAAWLMTPGQQKDRAGLGLGAR